MPDDPMTDPPLPARSPFRPVWPWVACVAVALVWPASEAWYAWATVPVGGRTAGVSSGPGWVAAFVRPGGPAAGHAVADAGRITPTIASYRAYTPVYSRPDTFRFWCPTWVVSAGAGVWAAGLAVSRLRRRDVGPGRCPGCGYDLRASPRRCPECGRNSGPATRSV